MTEHSPSFRETHRNSNSPVPLRSPSPDFLTKSAILSTPQTHINYKHRQENIQNAAILEEVTFLRNQNIRLKQIAETKQSGNLSSSNNLVREKDRIIEDLKSQLKQTELKSNKKLSLIGNSGHKNQQSESNRELQHDNEQLRIKIRKLIEENQQLRKKKYSSGQTTPQKLKPLVKDEPISFPLEPQSEQFKFKISKLKEELTRQFNHSFQQLFKGFNLKLQDIQNRVISIENKITHNFWRQHSGSKDPVSTIGNVSPGFSSNLGNTANKNSNFHTPEDKRTILLNNRISQLEQQLSRLKYSEHNYKILKVQLQQQISLKNNQIKYFQEQFKKATSSGHLNSSLSDSKSKKLAEQNNSMRQSLMKLSAQLTNYKNDKINLQKQVQNLKRDLENQRKLKIPSFGGANQTDQHIIQQLNTQIQNYENQNKQIINENISLKDTLNQLRRTAAQTVNQFGDNKKQIISYKSKIDRLQKQIDELTKNRLKSDSNAEIQTQTQIVKLRLRINQLQRCQGQNQFINNQLKNTNDQLNNAHSEIRQLKGRLFDYETQSHNLRKQVQRAYSLAEENEMLKRTIASHERSQEELLKGSDHTKNQLMRANQDRLSLQNEIIQLKSNLRMSQNDLNSSKDRLQNLQRQYKIVEQQLHNGAQRYNQLEFNLNNIVRDRNQLLHENQLLVERSNNLQQQLQKLLADNKKQQLLNQINILTTRLRDSEHHLSNSQRLQQQKNNQLKSALMQLAEVKRLLMQMNFSSVEAVIRELQNKERILEESRKEMMKISHQNTQQISKLSFQNDKIKKEALQWSQKFIAQKQKADRLFSEIAHLQNQKNSLNQKILRLDDVIKQYIHQDSPIKLADTNYLIETSQIDERTIRRQLEQVDHLKQPINRAVQKLERVAEKILNKIQESQNKKESLGIAQTHSYMIPTSTFKDPNHQ